jgi:hypothetical protein
MISDTDIAFIAGLFDGEVNLEMRILLHDCFGHTHM